MGVSTIIHQLCTNTIGGMHFGTLISNKGLTEIMQTTFELSQRRLAEEISTERQNIADGGRGNVAVNLDINGHIRATDTHRRLQSEPEHNVKAMD